jgi:4-alpha-glucanotransferase
MPRTHFSALRRLASLYGVQTAYYNTTGRRQQAESESLLIALRLLGAPLQTLNDVPAALREGQQALWQQGVEPVVVVWNGTPASLEIRLPMAQASGPASWRLRTETGEVRSWDDDVTSLPTLQTTNVEGVLYVIKRCTFSDPLPTGYHHVTLTTAGQQFEAQLISAPKRAYVPSVKDARKEWGVFLPLYALHSEQSWGSGDFSDLEALTAWIAELGGSVVATLPLLSAFLDTPYDPSPYVPASRLFWNELYIDVTRAPGLQACPAAQALLHSTVVQEALADLRAASQVDYRRQLALKRQVLEELARWFFAAPSEVQTDFRSFLKTHPAVEDYACFRATGERRRAPWTAWPVPLRHGFLTESDYDAQVRNYHLYVQWVAHEQLKSATERGRAAGVSLYLDLPLGVHPQSYDVWREREIFVRDATAGAPPDDFFTKGQNWGFPPLHPEAIRKQSYRYCLAYLRHQLRHTGLLRIDHVMGLHRLFWVPRGLEPHQGVYVRYAAEELYAILNLESHRHQVGLVGENLGTVPTYVNTTMARHHLHRMYVVQYELTPASGGVLRPVPRDAVASLNTHDMPPFMAYWQGLDITDRLAQGLVTREEAQRERQRRQVLLRAMQNFLQQQGLLTEAATDVSAVLKACLAFLSASPGRIVLANLEDLWLETQPQNFPGTGDTRPNWQWKARYSLEAFRHRPQVLATLRTVNHHRKQGTDLS